MAATLAAWLTAGASLPWVWGRTDCTIWVADWCCVHFGHDPAAAFRGMYACEAGAERLIAAGLARTIGPWMAPLRPTASAQAGDVGVVTIRGREVAAICTGTAWAVRTQRGLFEGPLKPIIAWGD